MAQQLVVATRLGDTFHEDVDLRLLRHMNIVYIDQFSRDDLQEMVTSALQKHFSKGYSNAVSKLAKVSPSSSLATFTFNYAVLFYLNTDTIGGYN